MAQNRIRHRDLGLVGEIPIIEETHHCQATYLTLHQLNNTAIHHHCEKKSTALAIETRFLLAIDPNPAVHFCDSNNGTRR